MLLSEWLSRRGVSLAMYHDAQEHEDPARLLDAAARRPDWERIRQIAALVGDHWCHRWVVARRTDDAQTFAKAMQGSPEWAEMLADLAQSEME